MALNDALQVMTFRNVRHLPVVEEGQLLGVLSIREVLQLRTNAEQKAAGLCARDVCGRDPCVASVNDRLRDAAKDMAEQKVDCALIVDEEENLAGIFTTTDACRLIHLILSDREAAQG